MFIFRFALDAFSVETPGSERRRTLFAKRERWSLSEVFSRNPQTERKPLQCIIKIISIKELFPNHNLAKLRKQIANSKRTVLMRPNWIHSWTRTSLYKCSSPRVYFRSFLLTYVFLFSPSLQLCTWRNKTHTCCVIHTVCMKFEAVYKLLIIIMIICCKFGIPDHRGIRGVGDLKISKPKRLVNMCKK